MYECRIAFDAEFWTMIAALISACALVASVRAIKAARDIDQNNEKRIAARERRDAVPLALAIQYEVQRCIGFGEGIEKMRQGMPVGHAADICRELRNDRERALTAVLLANINELGCFDTETGKAAAGALTMSDMMYRTLRLGDDFIARRAEIILDSLVILARQQKPAYERAEELLSHYTNVPTVRTHNAAQAAQRPAAQ